MKKLKELEISLAKNHRFPNHKKLVNCEIETVILISINPINSKKYVVSFSWIFHFWLIDFLGYVDLCKILEVGEKMEP